MAKEVLSSAVTLTGDGIKNLNNLISDYNSTASSGQEIMLRDGDGGQILASGQTIEIGEGVIGITHHVNAENIDIYESDRYTRFGIKKILHHDPDKEVLIVTFQMQIRQYRW